MVPVVVVVGAAQLHPLVAAAALWPLGRPMDLLSLGETEAQSLGVDVKSLRRRLLVLATVLAATATSVAGIVGFVGLVVPHGLRLLVGPEHRRLGRAGRLRVGCRRRRQRALICTERHATQRGAGRYSLQRFT